MRPPELGGWRAIPVRSTQLVDPAPVRALAALLDSGLDVPGPGDVLPALWHWCALPRWAAATTTGVDGHPPRGAFLPPVDLPRRMFAGGQVDVLSPLVVGESVERTDEVTSVEEKSGRSGPLVVVAVTTELRASDGTLRLRERQDLVFRGDAGGPAQTVDPTSAARAVPAGAPLEPLVALPAAGHDTTWSVRTDPTLLMRFSAASANLHRIHYDWPYATQVEGYPGLVVQGPLMTVLLAETLRLAGHVPAHSSPLTLSHRNHAPLFCSDPATISHERVDGAVVATLAGTPDLAGAATRDPTTRAPTTRTTLTVTPAVTLDDDKETHHA